MKDSISSAGSYHNPYTTQSFLRPAHQQQPAPLQSNKGISGGKDSLEISQERLEQQVAARFHSNNFQLPNQSLTMVAMAGKYAFYAAALPLYIILYGIPKWVLFVAMPELLTLIQQQLAKACRAIKERFVTLTEPIVTFCKEQIQAFKKALGIESKASFLMSFVKAPWNLAQTLWNKTVKAMQMTLRKLTQTAKASVTALKNAVHSLYSEIKSFSRQVIRMPLNAVKASVNLMKRFAESVKKGADKLKNMPKEMLKALKRFGEGALTTISYPFKALKQVPKKIAQKFAQMKVATKSAIAHLILPWMAPIAPKLYQSLLNKLSKNNPKLMQSISKRAEGWKKSLAPYVNAAGQIKRALIALSQPHKLAKQIYEKMRHMGKSAFQQLMRENAPLPVKMLKAAYRGTKRLVESARRLGSKSLAKLQELPQQLAMLLPTPLINWLGIQQNMQYNSWFGTAKKRIKGRLSKRMQAVSARFNKVKAIAVRVVSGIREKAYSFCRSLWNYPKKYMRFTGTMSGVVKATRMAVRRRIHWFRLLLAWFSVLRRHWLTQIQATASELGNRTRQTLHLNKLDLLPRLTALDPDCGSNLGGTVVTLTGKNFAGTTSVNFGGVKAVSFTINSDSSITAVAPSQPSGRVYITVTTAAGTSGATIANRYTYSNVPVIESASTTNGPVAGGTVVNLKGTSFTNVVSIFFGSLPAIRYTINSDNSIVAIAPAAASVGTVDLIVASNTAADSVNFLYT